MSSYREWTLVGLFGLRNYEGRTIPPETIIKSGPSLLPDDTVVVVEKSAYDELLAKYNFMVDSAQVNGSERDRLESLVRWLHLGIQHFTNEEDLSQVAHLLKGVNDLLESLSNEKMGK